MAGSLAQAVWGNDSAVSGSTIASGAAASSVTAGSLLQITVTCAGADAGITFSVNAGTATLGAAVQREQQTEAGTGNVTTWFTVPVTGSGTLDVLATFNSAHGTRGISCAEITGVASFQTSISGTDTGNNPTGTLNVNVTTATAFALMTGVDVQGGANSLTVGSGWTSDGTTGTSNYKCTAQHKAGLSTGVVSGNFANASFDRNNTAILVYLESGPPVFTTQPSNVTVPDGSTATFTSAAISAGGTGLAYQWQDNSSGSFADISGATSATQTFGPLVASAAAGRQYRVKATDTNGTTTSNTVTLNFSAWPRGAKQKRRRRPNALGFFGALWTGRVGTGVQNWILRGLAPATGGGGSTYNLTLTESVTAADALATVLTAANALTESLTAGDLASSIATMAASLTESVTAADAVTGGLAFTLTLSEAITAADAIANLLTALNTVGEPITAGDAVTSGAVAINSLAESVTAADAATALGVLQNALAEAATLADALVDSLTGGNTYNVTLTEAVTASDAIASTLAAVNALIETLSPSDAEVASGDGTDNLGSAGNLPLRRRRILN